MHMVGAEVVPDWDDSAPFCLLPSDGQHKAAWPDISLAQIEQSSQRAISRCMRQGLLRNNKAARTHFGRAASACQVPVGTCTARTVVEDQSGAYLRLVPVGTRGDSESRASFRTIPPVSSKYALSVSVACFSRTMYSSRSAVRHAAGDPAPSRGCPAMRNA